MEKTSAQLNDLGVKIFQDKYRFKTREGFNISNQMIPKRFYETVSTLGKIDPEIIKEMLMLYKKKRGWP